MQHSDARVACLAAKKGNTRRSSCLVFVAPATTHCDVDRTVIEGVVFMIYVAKLLLGCTDKAVRMFCMLALNASSVRLLRA